jgi:hypothetical protein
MAACRAGGIRSNLLRKKRRVTVSDKLVQPEIPTPTRQQDPRNLVMPGRRGALPKATKPLFDNPNLLRIPPFPPPTFVDNRENLDLLSELMVILEVSNLADPRPPRQTALSGWFQSTSIACRDSRLPQRL